EPKKVFIQIGTNDYKKKKNDYIYNNIVRIVERLKDGVEGVEIYLISLYPVNHKAKAYSRFFTGPRRNNTIIELNYKLENYCDENKIKYIDVYSKLIDKDGNLDKQYTIEGLHISYEGYKIITDILMPYIQE